MRTSRPVYKFREGCHHTTPVAVIASEVEKVRKESPNELSVPSKLVEVSRPDDAPLHPEFTWDDEEAAERWREDEARRLTRCYYVDRSPEAEEPQWVIANVSVKAEDGTRGYMSTELALSHVETRDQVIQDATAGLQGWLRRFEHIEAVAESIPLVRAAVEQLKAAQEEAKQPEPKRPAPKAKYRDPKPRGKVVPVAAL